MNVAWLYKTFENNANARNFNGLNWDIQGEWKPLKQSVVTLHTSQNIKDPSEVGGYILFTKYGVSYQHFWLGIVFYYHWIILLAGRITKNRTKIVVTGMACLR